MRIKAIRLRLRRRLRLGRRQVGGLGGNTEEQIERHFVKRLGHLERVRKFVTVWLGVAVLLIAGLFIQNILLSGYFQKLQPVPGGIYNEGDLGTFTNANPMYATSDVNAAVSRLIFAGLFTYDNQNRLASDLASSYSVDASGTVYTVQLKPNLTWQDGQPLTSADVAFTYHLIQNPDTQSPLQTGWQGINVTTPNSRTVVFKLPNPLASFPYNMTNGIVPEHLLKNIPPSGMRSADFNTLDPIGAGPFVWHAIQVSGNDPSTAQEQIALVPFNGYARGKPKLQEFIMHAYASQKDLEKAFRGGKLTAAAGLTSVPPDIQKKHSIEVHNQLLTAETMVFFKTTSGVLADKSVRQALAQGTDKQKIIKSLGYPTNPINEPLLEGQIGFDPSLAQAGYNLTAARQALDADGWTVGKAGWRVKGGQTLAFTLSTADTSEYRLVTKQLQSQWKQLGVQLRVQLEDAGDFHNTLAYHNYDAVLYSISIGPDPDVFVYWDSSQADVRASNRLNFSEYKNASADEALEAGRTRLNPGLRAVKYRPFLQAWQQDYPAVGLYQPRALYLTNGPVFGLGNGSLNTAAGRFDNVQNWEIHEARVTN